ncbi:MAG: hypothetical protein ACI9YB_001724, partial [Halioglobus sp.]
MSSFGEISRNPPPSIISGAWDADKKELVVKKGGHAFKVLTLDNLKETDMKGANVQETATKIAKLFMKYQDTAAGLGIAGVGKELQEGDTLSAKELSREGGTLIDHQAEVAATCAKIMKDILGHIHGTAGSDGESTGGAVPGGTPHSPQGGTTGVDGLRSP